MNRVLDVHSAVPKAAQDPRTVVQGDPQAGSRVLDAFAGVEVGVWEMTAGTATDVEADEVFVVLTGSATVTFADGARLDLQPGMVVRLREGEQTTWAVHETLRKVYVT